MLRDDARAATVPEEPVALRRPRGKLKYERLNVETPRDAKKLSNGSTVNDNAPEHERHRRPTADAVDDSTVTEDEDDSLRHTTIAVVNGSSSPVASGIPWTQVALVALSAISGFLFGYDLCVMVVALPLIHKAFDLSTETAEAVVSILMIGAVFGALAGGVLADRIGRKRAVIVTSVFFLAGSTCMTFAESIYVLLLGRFLAGLAVGSSGPCVSTYVAEIADLEHRGALVTINEVMVCVGCVVSVGVSSLLEASVDGWRKMLGVTLIPPLVQLAGMPFVPESPRWLISQKDRMQEARAVLHRLFPQQSADDTDAQIKAQLASKGFTTSLWNALQHIASDDVTRRRVVLSLSVALAHTATAANAMLYYSSYIIDSLGAGHVGGKTTSSSFSGISKELGVAIAKLAGVCTAVVVIDHVGRRTLLLVGSVMMLAADLVFAWCFWGMDATGPADDRGALTPTAGSSETLGIWTLYLFIYAWNLSWAPLMFVIGSEVLPDDLRSIGMGLTFAVFWLGSSLVNQTLLTTFELCGMAASFLVYGSLTAGAIAFIYVKLPETRGRSFEEITKLFSVTP